ncbi:MAG: hypothetical protein V4695_00725 [Pseudomonadota bacterium]
MIPAAAAAFPKAPTAGTSADQVPDAQVNASPFNDSLADLKERIAGLIGPDDKKVVRLLNKSFRQAGAAHLTKLIIPFKELDKIEATLASLPAVTNVTIEGFDRKNDDTDAHLATLAQLAPNIRAKIQHLHLECSYVTDASLAHVQSLPNLRSLDLGWCEQISGSGFAHFQKLTQLRSMKLNHCEQLTDADVAGLKSLKQLQSLDLSECEKITDIGIAHLQSLTQLQSLDLGRCFAITDAGIAHLYSLKQLRWLGLCLCRHVTYAGLAHLHNRNCMGLDLT